MTVDELVDKLREPHTTKSGLVCARAARVIEVLMAEGKKQELKHQADWDLCKQRIASFLHEDCQLKP